MGNKTKIRVDYENGQAEFKMGRDLANTNPMFRVDVLSDIQCQVEGHYHDAFEEMCPGLFGFTRCVANRDRRLGVAALIGKTITGAVALSDGNIAFEFNGAEVLVFANPRSDVVIQSASSLDEAVAHADQADLNGAYTDELDPEDEIFEEEVAEQVRVMNAMGIAFPE